MVSVFEIGGSLSDGCRCACLVGGCRSSARWGDGSVVVGRAKCVVRGLGDGSTGQRPVKKSGQDQGPVEESLHRDLAGLGPTDFQRWACMCPKGEGLMV